MGLDALEQMFREIDEAQAIVQSTCLLGNSEAHDVLVAKGASGNLQDSLFLLDEWCYRLCSNSVICNARIGWNLPRSTFLNSAVAEALFIFGD